MICIWSNCCHCHPIISCLIKIHNGLPFLCQLTQVVQKKGLLDGFSVIDWQHFILVNLVILLICLQCFDAVGWVAGRASGL